MKKGTFFDRVDMAVKDGEVKSLGDALDKFVPLGLSFVEVFAGYLQDRYQPKELLKTLKDSGVLVASIFHIIDFKNKEEFIPKNLLEDTKQQLALCAELESPMYMPVPRIFEEHGSEANRMTFRERVVEYFQDVTEQAKQFGITAIFENFSTRQNPYSRLDDVTYIMEQVPEMAYAFDSGNFWISETDTLAAAKQFAAKTVHVHVKDISPNEYGAISLYDRTFDSVAIGDGIIPFKEIFSVLKSEGFDKTVSVEINACSDNTNLIGKVEKSLKYLNSIGV